MTDRRYEQAGLCGFILAGLIFTAAGLRDGDPLVTAGSIVWIVACLLWLVPHMRLQATGRAGSTHSEIEGSDDG